MEVMYNDQLLYKVVIWAFFGISSWNEKLALKLINQRADANEVDDWAIIKPALMVGCHWISYVVDKNETFILISKWRWSELNLLLQSRNLIIYMLRNHIAQAHFIRKLV